MTPARLVKKIGCIVDAELQRRNAEIAVLQTARAAYSKALKEMLPDKALNS